MRFQSLLLLCLFWASQLVGCGPAVRLFGNTGDKSKGITFYIGGAGQYGNVGSIDVPGGLKDAGYEGAVEIFTWQLLAPIDQINLSRNRSKGADLAGKIQKYQRKYPDNEINIVALSAGTGIAVFALEYLPANYHVNHVVFLGSSLSSRHDLTRALRRVDGNMYVLYSPRDMLLNTFVPYTGTVDRASGSRDGVAGLRGIRMPHSLGADTERYYTKVYNVPWRPEFSSAGYDGGHTDATKRDFVRRYLAPLIMGNDEKLIGKGGRYAEFPFGSHKVNSLPADNLAKPDRQVQ